MIMEMIAKDVYKVELSSKDLYIFGLTYDSLDHNDKKTKDFLSKIIDEVITISQYRSIADKRKVYVESFPDANGGCILFVNLSSLSIKDIDKKCTSKPSSQGVTLLNEPLHKDIREYCYIFDNLATTAKAVSAVVDRIKPTRLKSSLYRVGEYYALVLSYYKEDRIITVCDMILKEFVSVNAKKDSVLDYSYLHFLQQGSLIMEKDAIANIYNYLY